MTDEEKKAHALFAEGDFTGAEILFRQWALNEPENAAAHYNLGVTLGKLDRIEEALSFYRRAIELNPAFADAYINFGVCLNELGLVAQARQSFALARKITPDNPAAILNEGIAALALGDYEQGWQGFAARWRFPAYAKFKRDFAQAPWHGEDLAERTLFLYAEQGFGDTVQMARYVPLLTARGAHIIIEAPPALGRLLHSLHGGAEIIVKGDPIPAFDFYCALMDLPRLCGTLLDSIPSSVPYLFADAAETESYHARLPSQDKKRIGLCWSGRGSHENNRNRSLALAQIAPLLALPNIEWISLQRLVPDADVAFLDASNLVDCGRKFADFAETAACIMNCDLVISVDTAVAHVAGALGKPLWVLLPFYADWRWLTGCEDSPWYPSARLFRQKKRRGWEDVIEEIATLLS